MKSALRICANALNRCPDTSGARQIRYDGALHARRHRHDLEHQEPARPTVTASQEAQQEARHGREGLAADITARGHVPPSIGGR